MAPEGAANESAVMCGSVATASFEQLIQALVAQHEREVQAALQSVGKEPNDGGATSPSPADASPSARTCASEESSDAESDKEDAKPTWTESPTPRMTIAPPAGILQKRRFSNLSIRIAKPSDCPYKIQKDDRREQEEEGAICSREASKKATWTDTANKNACMWTLGRSVRRRGGPEHIDLETKAEQVRIENDAIETKVGNIKDRIKYFEEEMLELMHQLQPFAQSLAAMDDGAQRNVERVEAVIANMETCDLKLANLRAQQLNNIESVRGCKVRIWCLVAADRVDHALEEMQNAIRFGKEGWPNGAQRKALFQLEEELWELKSQLAAQCDEYHRMSSDLMAQSRALEAKLADATHAGVGLWCCNSDEERMLTDLMKITHELKTVAWKRSRSRDKQLAVFHELFRLRRVQAMLDQRLEIEKIARSSDAASIRGGLAKLTGYSDNVQETAKATKVRVAEVLSQASVLQTELRALRHVENRECDAKRDRLMRQIAEVELEDNRLAWLRKTQLHALDLCRLLRSTIATAAGDSKAFRSLRIGSHCQPGPENLSEWNLKEVLGGRFCELDESGDGVVAEHVLRRVLVAVGLSEVKVDNLLASAAGVCMDGQIKYSEFLEWLSLTPRGQGVRSPVMRNH